MTFGTLVRFHVSFWVLVFEDFKVIIFETISVVGFSKQFF